MGVWMFGAEMTSPSSTMPRRCPTILVVTSAKMRAPSEVRLKRMMGSPVMGLSETSVLRMYSPVRPCSGAFLMMTGSTDWRPVFLSLITMPLRS